MKTLPKTLLLLPVFSLSLQALEVEVQRATNDGLPWGYQDVSEFSVDEDPNTEGRQNSVEYDQNRSINVSEDPYVDYFVAFNSGVAGVLAEKVTGEFLEGSESTVANLSGGANGGFIPDFGDREFDDRYSSAEMPVGLEKFAAFATWDDGFPLPSSTSWWGVSWGGWSPVAIEEMEVRVNLESEDVINVAHLFNDGWYYSTDLGNNTGAGTAHRVLEGHEFVVTHHAPDATVIAEESFVLPSGGVTELRGNSGELLFDNWRQFYTALISVQRTAAGEYLMLKHRAANIGYRMTLVTLGDSAPWGTGDEAFTLQVDEYQYLESYGWTYGLSEEWGFSVVMGYLYFGSYPSAVYSNSIGWLVSSTGTIDEGVFFYSLESASWIWTSEGFGGFYYDFGTAEWKQF